MKSSKVEERISWLMNKRVRLLSYSSSTDVGEINTSEGILVGVLPMGRSYFFAIKSDDNRTYIIRTDCVSQIIPLEE